MHSCKFKIGLQLEPVYFFLLHPGTNILMNFYLLGQCSRPRLLILLSGTVTGSLCHRYKPAYFFLFWPRISYSFEWNRNRFSFHLLKNGTVCSICLLVCSPIWSWLVHCSTDESSWASLLARPMLQAETPCLLGQCFQPRLLAWFGSRRVPRSAVLLPGTAATLLEEEVSISSASLTTSSALWPWYLVLCWLTWVARSTALLLGPLQSSRPSHPIW